MKFARYLEDAQTPEWKRAYINYRGLKKRITAIRKVEELSHVSVSSLGSSPLHNVNTPSSGSPLLSETHGHSRDYGSSIGEIRPPRTVHINGRDANSDLHVERPPLYRETSSMFGGFTRLTLTRTKSQASRLGLHARIEQLEPPLTLTALLAVLPPVHIAFFGFLDDQLEKVESFYLEREKEARERSTALREQLSELQDHRRIFYETHPENVPWHSALTHSLSPAALKAQLNSLPIPISRSHSPDLHKRYLNGKSRMAGPVLDPEEYQHAKKKLKKAVLEFYRGLEVLNNYRILNLTGFRKALKKYEKVTGVPAQQVYIQEKVEKSAFASGTQVGAIMRDMEQLFAARFERGNKKRAMARLRAGAQTRSHHFSTFRTGVMLGLGVPAVVAGIYQCFQESTRQTIPVWQALMFAWSILLVPLLFALLIGLNLHVWSQARINYTFIFELDLRTRLDYHEYFEIPAFLLMTLAYAFWFSFSGISVHTITPTTWPLAWLVFAACVMFNPLPVQSKTSRWWLLRNVGKLLTSGAHHVEFTDFWMGDQFCSLVFTLSNLFFFFCVYADGFDAAWTRCNKPTHWAVPFVLASLPLLARLVQSVRRYVDSKLVTHLINGGKYGSGVVYYLFYFLWRHQNASKSGAIFVLYITFAIIYAIYASSWDLLMDWSFFRPHAKYPLLRPELVYIEHIPLYYFAMVSNVLIRFIWIFYLPISGPSFTVRTFIGGMLEMLRRIQWNFYRLENEHIGNMDQYRVTREVPLPYQFDDPSHDNDNEDRDEDGVSMHSSWMNGQRRRRRTASLENDESTV